MDIKEIRKECGSWDEEFGCLDEEKEMCPYAKQCDDDAEADELAEEEVKEEEGEDDSDSSD